MGTIAAGSAALPAGYGQSYGSLSQSAIERMRIAGIPESAIGVANGIVGGVVHAAGTVQKWFSAPPVFREAKASADAQKLLDAEAYARKEAERRAANEARALKEAQARLSAEARAADQALIEAAKKEGSVAVYSALSGPPQVERMKAFEKQYGIRVYTIGAGSAEQGTTMVNGMIPVRREPIDEDALRKLEKSPWLLAPIFQSNPSGRMSGSSSLPLRPAIEYSS